MSTESYHGGEKSVICYYRAVTIISFLRFAIYVLSICESSDEMVDLGFVNTVVFLPSFPRVVRMLGSGIS